MATGSDPGAGEAALWSALVVAMPLPAAAWTLDGEGHLLFAGANDAAVRLAGVDLDARRGQPFTALFSASTLAEGLAAAARGQKRARLSPLVSQDGRAFAAEIVPLGPGAVGAVFTEIAITVGPRPSPHDDGLRPARGPLVPPAPEAPAPARAGTILVIDDEPLVGRLVERALGRGHRVRAVVTGREGLDLLSGGERFDLILCDLMMPEMTGMDLYEHVKAFSVDQAGRMVFLTGGAFTRRARDFLEERPYLEKPFDLSALEALVKGRLG